MGRPSAPFIELADAVSKAGWLRSNDTGTQPGITTRKVQKLNLYQRFDERFRVEPAIRRVSATMTAIDAK